MRNEYREDPPKKKSSPLIKIFAIGCLSIIIMGAFGVYWITQNIKGLVASGAGKIVELVVDETPLPEQEKKEIMKPINNFIAQYKDGKISDLEGQAVLKKLAEGAVFQAAALRLFEAVHIEKSSLPDEAKQTAKITLSRYRKAFLDKIFKNTEGDLEAINKIITYEERSADETKHRLKKSLTPEELQQCLEIMKTQADLAKIPVD